MIEVRVAHITNSPIAILRTVTVKSLRPSITQKIVNMKYKRVDLENVIYDGENVIFDGEQVKA